MIQIWKNKEPTKNSVRLNGEEGQEGESKETRTSVSKLGEGEVLIFLQSSSMLPLAEEGNVERGLPRGRKVKVLATQLCPTLQPRGL